MRYKIECKSLLLQKALENFLKEYLDESGLIISDYDGDIIIGKDIKKPFTKSQLLIQLEKLDKIEKFEPSENLKKNMELEIDMSIFEEFDEKPSKINNTFEEKLDILINEFSKNLKQLIKEEYGKK